MGLSWQHGPLGRNPNAQLLVPGMPQRVLCAEPLRRRMRAELGGRTVVQGNDAVLVFEPDRVEVRLDGERLELEPGQTVVSHGIDRDLTIDEAGALTAVLEGAS
jgi:hypothetical protein